MALSKLNIGVEAPILVRPDVGDYGFRTIGGLLTVPYTHGLKFSELRVVRVQARKLPACAELDKHLCVVSGVGVVAPTQENCGNQKRSHAFNSDSNTSKSQGAA